MLTHHPVKSGDNEYCGSGDIIVLVCHVILHNHMTTESGNFMGKGPSR